MYQFDCAAFASLLRAAPPRRSIFEQPEHSDYVEQAIFAPLRRDEPIDLQLLDFDRFSLRHVTSEDYVQQVERAQKQWCQGFNRYLKHAPAIPRHQKQFF